MNLSNLFYLLRIKVGTTNKGRYSLCMLIIIHQDVVPVDPNTVDQWTHPPYSGYFDG